VALLLSRSEVDSLIDPLPAMAALEAVMVEEVAGTASHMPPYGGTAQRLRTPRIVGGGLHTLGRMGLRAGGIVTLFDLQQGGAMTGEPLAVMGYGLGNLRVGATMGLAARYLALPEARAIGILGSGMNAMAILSCLCAVRPIAQVAVFSPTREHRESLAARAQTQLGIPVTAHDRPEPVIAAADILAVATDSKTPVLRFDQIRPGTHVTSMGLTSELDASCYLQADQFVAASRDQEIDSSAPGPNNPGNVDGGPLWRLLEEERIAPERIVELGAIVRGDLPPRNGPTDVTVFRESRGGVGDTALANWVYEEARRRGLGTEFDFR
jgi:alanine dehydrogenase